MAKNAQAVASEAQPEGESEVEQLRRELAEARGQLAAKSSQAESSESRARQAEQRVLSEAEQKLLAQEQACDGTITSKNSEADSIESQIATLSDEPGHGKEIASLTRKLAVLETEIQNEKAKKQWLGNQRAQAATAAKAQIAQDNRLLANGTPLSAIESKAAQEWFKAHPRCFTDAKYLREVIRAAEDAADEGIATDTADYFAYVEERVGETGNPQNRQVASDVATAASPYSGGRQVAGDGEVEYEAEKPQPRAAGPGTLAAAIPPSRTARSSPTDGGRRRAPMLSAEQREVADSIFGHIANPADRYAHYVESERIMNAKRGQNRHFQS